MKIILSIITGLLFIGCSHSIHEVDIEGKNKECVNQCKRIHTSSISDKSETESKRDILRSAKYTYQICVNTCK